MDTKTKWTAKTIAELRGTMTAQAFATAVGVSISTVNGWKKGWVLPDDDNREKLDNYARAASKE
jgi:DNA-binding transcriptional regulator YiaG